MTSDLGLKCLCTGLPLCVCSLEGGGANGKGREAPRWQGGKGRGGEGCSVCLREQECVCAFMGGWVGGWVSRWVCGWVGVKTHKRVSNNTCLYMCVCMRMCVCVCYTTGAHSQNRPHNPLLQLQYTATHCNTLQHTATHHIILQHTATF